MNVSYNDFEEKDSGDLRDMMFRLYEEDPEGEPITDEKIRKTINECKNCPEKVRLIMLSADGRNIGYCILVYFWSNEYGGDAAVIDELYIMEEYRNQGIGTAFIKHLMNGNKNAVSLEVESTPSNKAAARLYKRLGFKKSENDHMVLFLTDKDS